MTDRILAPVETEGDKQRKNVISKSIRTIWCILLPEALTQSQTPFQKKKVGVCATCAPSKFTPAVSHVIDWYGM